MRKRLLIPLLLASAVVGMAFGYALMVGSRQLRERHHVAWPELVLSDVSSPLFAEPLRSLHAFEAQTGVDGKKYSITDPNEISASGVTHDDGILLHSICRTIKPQNTLEIGFARGVSTLYILAALSANGFGMHTAVDPFERSDWHGIGLKKVQETHSEDRFRFIEAKSIAAISQLFGRKYDFIFIDGGHLFDEALVDFELSDLYCSDNCVIAIHDAEYLPAVQKAIRFIELNRADYVRLQSPLKTTALFRRKSADKRNWHHFADF